MLRILRRNVIINRLFSDNEEKTITKALNEISKTKTVDYKPSKDERFGYGKHFYPRLVTPITQYIRDSLLQREYVEMHRYEQDISERTQPQPNLPGGVNHRLAFNDYHERDGRRMQQPPLIVHAAGQPLKMIDSGDGKPAERKKLPTPGFGLNLDTDTFDVYK